MRFNTQLLAVSKVKLLIVALLCGVIGLFLQLWSHAATSSVSVESESGNLNGVTVTSDTSASGGKAVQFSTASGAAYTASNLPWMLKPGESVNDNVPSNVAVVEYDSYSQNGALAFGQTLGAIRSAMKVPYYVRMSAGTFHVTDFSYATWAGIGYGRGYQDTSSTKLFAGIIGAGADKTIIQVDPNIMTTTQLADISAGHPNVSVLYVGDSLNVPVVISGITFRGSFQQSVALSGLSGTAPAPYAGLYLPDTPVGSIIQFCRFQGFGFTAKGSPPYELGAIISNHATYTLRRSEIDGRLATEVNSAQPVSSGGLMWNYERNVKVIDSWLHGTRRSGWAQHDHDPTEGGNANDPGVYYSNNFQVEDIAAHADSFAGSVLGFPPSNVEEMRQSFTYIKPRFQTGQADGAHISILTSNGNTIANSITITDPVILNTAYNGCLVVRFAKAPNALGDSPYYTLYTASGLDALPIHVTNNGVTLTPVLRSNFNAATTKPDKNFIVTF